MSAASNKTFNESRAALLGLVTTKRRRRRRRSLVSIWDDPRTRLAQAMAYEGFGYLAISRASDLTIGQLSYRFHKLGTSPTTWRRGKSGHAREKIAKLKRRFNVA